MTDDGIERGRLLLLGRNYGEYGGLASTRVGSHSAAAISVGTDATSPAGRWKYDSNVANEDALCVIDAGEWIGMAVADAHYGPEASHVIIERLHEMWAKIRPTDVEHLGQMIEFLRNGDPARTESETTLLVSVFDRESGRGFGVSFGDSTIAVAGADRIPMPVNPQDTRFVSTADRRSLLDGSLFTYRAAPGELIIMHTDGIDGCHYREPDTSVRPRHVHEIARRNHFDPFSVVNEVSSLALDGVDGYPGGQDNIVMIATSA
ncbi:MAG: hypothetical protein ACR2P0_14700 [Acidimicrobiales bacterium]